MARVKLASRQSETRQSGNHGTSFRLYAVPSGRAVQWLSGRRAATTCGNGVVESSNVARQSGFAIVNMRV